MRETKTPSVLFYTESNRIDQEAKFIEDNNAAAAATAIATTTINTNNK